MAAVLTITNSEICKLCRLDPADSTADADATEVQTNAQEAYEAYEAYEAMIRPSALADSSLTFLLRRNVAKLLAAEVLAMRRREDGAGESFQGAGVTLGKPDDFGAQLRAEALADLAPYLLRPSGVNVVAGGAAAQTSSASASRQRRLFGPSEGDSAGSDTAGEL
jgi:hypothetical protein